jgi:hypothetical protein
VLIADDLCGTASAEIEAPAEHVYALLVDPLQQSRWTLGSWERRDLGDGLSVGRSLVSGDESYVRTDPCPERLLVDYWVGPAPDALARSISIRVVRGEALGRDARTCVVTIAAWRTAGADAWRATCELHHVEVRTLKRLAEAAPATPTP